MHFLGIASGGCVSGHFNESEKFFPGNRSFFKDSYRTPTSHEMLELLGAQIKILLYRRTLCQRHFAMRKAARRADGHTMPASDAQFIRLGNRCWIPIFLEIDKTGRTNLCADSVLIARFLIDFKQIHFQPLLDSILSLDSENKNTQIDLVRFGQLLIIRSLFSVFKQVVLSHIAIGILKKLTCVM